MTYSYTNKVTGDDNKITPTMTVGGYVGDSKQGIIDQDIQDLPKSDVTDKVVKFTFVNAKNATAPRIIIGMGGKGGSFDGTCQITKIELIPKDVE